MRANTQFNLSNGLRRHEQRLSIITFCPFLSGVILCLEISLSCSVFWKKKKNSIWKIPLDGCFHNGSFVTFFHMHFYWKAPLTAQQKPIIGNVSMREAGKKTRAALSVNLFACFDATRIYFTSINVVSARIRRAGEKRMCKCCHLFFFPASRTVCLLFSEAQNLHLCKCQQGEKGHGKTQNKINHRWIVSH